MQTFKAKVVSAKAAKTVSVVMDYIYQHRKYKKILRKKTKLLVHNELEGIKEGDTVQIIKSKPYSKLKHFSVVKKV